jgi:acetoin utilization deacetylase AcuC-like enzyme
MGFCFVNNVAVAAKYALERHGLKRVAIVDFDVHHGNGTEQILANEPGATLCSAFQHPLYPHRGIPPLGPNMWPVPIRAGSDGAAWRRAIQEAGWFERLDAWCPQFVFFSAGFDAHAADPLAQLNLGEDDFTWITTEIRRIADRHADGRIVSTLEGGYDLEALASSVVAHVHAL